MPENMSIYIPQTPMVYAVKNVRHVVTKDSPVGTDFSIWQADVKACRHKIFSRIFEGVYFFEYGGYAAIAGLEMETGLSPLLEPEPAMKQQDFVTFLRAMTFEDSGPFSLIFYGHEYSNEGKATAAYLAARNISAGMGIGFWNESDSYEMIVDDPVEWGWLEHARSVLPFDELG